MARARPRAAALRALAAALLAAALARAQVVCSRDGAIPRVGVAAAALRRAVAPALRAKPGPAGAGAGAPDKRSVARCRGLVDSVAVPEAARSFGGVALPGVVSIVESADAWRGDRALRAATPSCSGMFIGADQVLSAAHCVFQQRLSADEGRFWLFGDGRGRRRFFYAVAGKASAADERVDVYPLQMACIPASYAAAVNESVTSGQGNDVVVFTTLAPFRGPADALATFADMLPTPGAAREYMLPQYPLDVARGRQLVIDVARSPLYRAPYLGGTFYTVDLVSWIGSSGGAVVDVVRSRDAGRPVIAGVLMSEGWEVCDSGVLPLTIHSTTLAELRAVSPPRPVQHPPREHAGISAEISELASVPPSSSADSAALPVLAQASLEPSEVPYIEPSVEPSLGPSPWESPEPSVSLADARIADEYATPTKEEGPLLSFYASGSSAAVSSAPAQVIPPFSLSLGSYFSGSGNDVYNTKGVDKTAPFYAPRKSPASSRTISEMATRCKSGDCE